MSDEAFRKRLNAFFVAALEDLEAAEALLKLGNRLAAYHVEQAVEKLTKAVLLARGIEAGLEHRLDILLNRLPENDEGRQFLWPLRSYSAYATAFRYPTPGGRLVDAPPAKQLAEDLRVLGDALTRLKTLLLPS